MYEERFYREIMKSRDLLCFNVTEGESDLQIFAKDNLEKETRRALIKCRSQLHEYIRKNPHFLTSLDSIKPQKNSPEIVKQMCRAAESAKVGPMAAVAGAVSKYVGLSLLKHTEEIIIENGGDIFLKTRIDRRISIYAGSSPFSNKIALLIPGSDEELGICTSSGTVGHSLSFGKADAAVILARDAVLADAAATAAGNAVKDQKDIEKGIETAMSIPGVEGVLIIVGDKMGAFGNINLIKP
ncbi:UPF0280 family protein [Lutispora sp.]|uniref:UPF0280 family protein n=1 Tax=Lutispora sp. TaxID=2828727 RepID=UPI000EC37A61|nr:UPF0280 family protein [Lutispora sp.]MEA4961810.1 UPF0280 family protein [Lutispora sp.]HCJ57222.1 hypothetical protein [Clostridiaceae bacterium]